MKPNSSPPHIRVIHKTPEYVVISKPTGIDSQNSRDDRPSIVGWLQKNYGFQGLVHRLDFGTSGIMVCALNSAAAKKLTNQMQADQIKRTYQALAMGTGLPSVGAFTTDIDGLQAATSYKVLETFANAMLLELDLETGRKHQIRKHLFEAGHPILGDHLYKKKGSDRLMNRPALHSFRLQIDGKTYQDPLPSDIEALIQRFRKSQADFNG